MKKFTGLLLITLIIIHPAKSQEAEIQQLLLNVEKLAQLKNILEDMKKGYEIVSKGYHAIKDISEGNFKLHQAYLDGLLQVSPVVQRYYKIGDLVSRQISLVKNYKAAFKTFKESGQFTEDELAHMANVYERLFRESLQNLDALSMILTNGTLRMSDDERLSAIDALHVKGLEQHVFLQKFNNSTRLLGLQRAKAAKENKVTQNLYGIKK